MEESTCHEMLIDLLKTFNCMKCLFFCTFSSVLNMIFTLALKELKLKPEKCQHFSALILTLWRERSSVGIFIDPIPLLR